MEKSGHVRKLDFRPGDDPCIRMGVHYLVPAMEAGADSKIESADGRDLTSHAELAGSQVEDFDGKAQWHRDSCAQ